MGDIALPHEALCRGGIYHELIKDKSPEIILKAFIASFKQLSNYEITSVSRAAAASILDCSYVLYTLAIEVRSSTNSVIFPDIL